MKGILLEEDDVETTEGKALISEHLITYSWRVKRDSLKILLQKFLFPKIAI